MATKVEGVAYATKGRETAEISRLNYFEDGKLISEMDNTGEGQ